MKKLNALAASFSAVAMLLGSLIFVACPDGNTNTEVEATVTGITVNADSALTQFVEGTEFSADGIIVKAVYSDNSKKTVASKDYTVALASENLDENSKVKLSGADLTAHKESAKVTVTYNNFTATYDVTIMQAAKKIEISVDSDTVKTSYTVGDELDYTGISVKAYYTEEDEEATDITSFVTFSATYVSGEDSLDFTTAAEGTYDVTFTASYGSLTASATSVTKISVAEKETETILENGAEEDARSNLGTMIYWNDQNWCGSNVTVNSASGKNGVYSLNYSATGSCTFGLQLFMAQNLTAGNTYLVSAKLKSSTAKTVVFNSNSYALEADTEKLVSSLVTGDGAITIISVQNPIDGDESESSFTLSDIVFTAIDESKLVLDSIEASLSDESIAVKGTASVSVTGLYNYVIDDVTYQIYQKISEGITLSKADGDETVTIDGTTITGVAASEGTQITVSVEGVTDTVSITVIDSTDYYKNTVLYSSTDNVDLLKTINTWNGGISSSASDDTTMTGIKVSFTSINGNSCGGFDFTEIPYNEGATLTMDVWASHNFTVKPVSPDKEFEQTVTTDGTYEKVSVSISLGTASSMKQLGFISSVVQDIYIDNVKITQASE